MSDTTAIEVDIIIPVHNASSTIKETVLSALHQEIPSTSQSPLLKSFLQRYTISNTVCCYDDGSKDDSLKILREIETSQSAANETPSEVIPSRLLVESSKESAGRGAGYARNRAVEMNNISLHERKSAGGKTGAADSSELKFLCLLDSDDIMHKHRIIEQVLFIIYKVDNADRNRIILGSTFDRDPPDSTWHYSNWANNLSDERLLLERFREITILQPTWFMPLAVWLRVGGYIEAPSLGSNETASDVLSRYEASGLSSKDSYLIHPKHDTLPSLKLAEDLRFFHSHLQSNGTLRLHRTPLGTIDEKSFPLVTYRHVEGDRSQSFRTSRKLLLQLRALAFQKSIIRAAPSWNTEEKRFAIWGCGRDGKDFFKALDHDVQQRVYCFVDVDAKKLNAGYYVDTTAHRETIQNDKDANGTNKHEKKRKQKNKARKIPIVHFSFLIRDQLEQEAVRSEWISNCATGNQVLLGSIDKSKNGVLAKEVHPKKKQKLDAPSKATIELQDRGLDHKVLFRIPVVVCVAMYRTNGVLESNAGKIGRTEGQDLWHFS